MSVLHSFGFHPLLAEWFAYRFGEPTEVQLQAWQALMAGKHTLIAAPTGSGKTLAALLPCLNHILVQKEQDSSAGVKLLYITPLKALNNDIHHHAARYVEELEERAVQAGHVWPGLSVGVRTGDTKPSVRAAMLRKPPDVLVTTPESCYLLLTSSKGREMLRTVRQVIVDEIHDLAGDRRGTHLSVTLERLTEWTGQTPQRIGVSATQKPITEVARYLGGWEHQGADALPRPVDIVESKMDKRITLQVTMPGVSFITADKQEAVWGPLTEHILRLMEGARSVIVFVNNRRLCERLTLRLNEQTGYELARSHHGSVAREQRLEVERALKAGELRCLVATASLELGIDVGMIDLVIQIDSPKSAAAGIQRIGRAGHAVGDVSRGYIVARSRGQLPECAVLARQIAAREIEAIRIPRHSLDVLCQQVVAMAASGDRTVETLYAVIARSYAFRGLPPAKLEAVLQVLSGYYPFIRPLLDWDRTSGLVTRRSNTLMAAIMGAGTIPPSSAYPVHHADSRIHLGELDEEFIHESRVGDVFQLGTSSWKIQAIRSDRIYVTEAGNRFSEIPFWRGEGQGRSAVSSIEVGRLLAELEAQMRRESTPLITAGLMDRYHLDGPAAEQLVALMHSQAAVSGIPTNRRLVIERFQDDQKQRHLVIHSWFGRTFNRTWLLALQVHLERRLPYRFYSNAKDNGIEFVFPAEQGVAVADEAALLREVGAAQVEGLLREAVPGSAMFGAAFRRLAETSLLLSRSFTRLPAWQRRLRSEELLRESLPYAEQFPFIAEAMQVCLNEELAAEPVKAMLSGIENGEIEVVFRNSSFPSPFAALFLADFANRQLYESDALAKDVQAHLIGLDRATAGKVFGETSVQSLLGEEESDSRRIGSGDELYRRLKERGDATAKELQTELADGSFGLLSELERQGRIVGQPIGSLVLYICADEKEAYSRLPEDAAARQLVLGRYIGSRLYVTAEELYDRYGLDRTTVEDFLRAEAARGRLEEAEAPRWLNREQEARRVRQSAALLKREEGVQASRYLNWLLELQFASPEARVTGPEGLREVIAQLQGLFLPLSQWETQVYPMRVKDYRKDLLDGLCSGGEVVWIGRKEEGAKEGSVAFFLAESKELLQPFVEAKPVNRHSELLELLRKRGASFLAALSRDAGRLASEVLNDLLDLAWDGLVSNDQFAPLRLNGSGGKAPSAGKGKAGAFQSGLGRWYVLEPADREAQAMSGSIMAWVRQLIGTFGLLTKDIVSQYLPWSWDEVYGTLKQLETWGVLTRGLWVRDIPALQFTEKSMVDRLRAPSWSRVDGVVVLPAADPANPLGLAVDWPSMQGAGFARKAGNYLVLQDGRWLLWVENNGKRIVTTEELGDLDEQALVKLLKITAQSVLKLSGLRKVVVNTWNKTAAAESEAAAAFRELGAEKDRSSFVLWPSMLS